MRARAEQLHKRVPASRRASWQPGMAGAEVDAAAGAARCKASRDIIVPPGFGGSGTTALGHQMRGSLPSGPEQRSRATGCMGLRHLQGAVLLRFRSVAVKKRHSSRRACPWTEFGGAAALQNSRRAWTEFVALLKDAGAEPLGPESGVLLYDKDTALGPFELVEHLPQIFVARYTLGAVAFAAASSKPWEQRLPWFGVLVADDCVPKLLAVMEGLPVRSRPRVREALQVIPLELLHSARPCCSPQPPNLGPDGGWRCRCDGQGAG
jgi:hypothetical protein